MQTNITRKSYEKSWPIRAKRVLAQGETGTNSKRASAYIEGVSPTHASRGDGCFFWDASGKKYLDMVGALGANLLGYRHPKVTEAVRKVLEDGGPSFSVPHTLEVEVAEMVCDMFHVERVRFLKNGDDATCAAIRWARAYYRNDPAHQDGYIWSEGYHGRSDIWTYLTPPSAGIVEDFHIQRSEPSNEYKGGIRIIEPIQLDCSDLRRQTLKEMRDRCDCLIFDEIITGGRVPKMSVSNWWNIGPDLLCLGKGLANGFPLSIVAGRAEIMDIPEVFISSTFSGETASLAACKATLTFLREQGITDFWYYANRFMDSVNKLIEPLDLKIEGYGTRGMFPMDKPNSAIFMQECHKAGIFIGKAWFYSWSHMEQMNEDVTLNLIQDVVTKILRGNVKMEGKPPVQTFKR